MPHRKLPPVPAGEVLLDELEVQKNRLGGRLKKKVRVLAGARELIGARHGVEHALAAALPDPAPRPQVGAV
jgi:hypothetical protein